MKKHKGERKLQSHFKANNHHSGQNDPERAVSEDHRETSNRTMLTPPQEMKQGNLESPKEDTSPTQGSLSIDFCSIYME